MAEYEPDKFIVINRKHLEKLAEYMPYGGNTVDRIIDMMKTLEFSYEYHTKNKLDQKYYVCNQDEPYAQKVIDVILEGEREKLKTPEQKEKEYQERKDDEFFDNNYT